MWKTILVCMEVLTVDIKAKEGFVEEKNYLPSKKKKKKEKQQNNFAPLVSHVASLKCKPAAMFCAKPPCYQRHFWLAWCWSPGQADGEKSTPGIWHTVGSSFGHRNSPEMFSGTISTLSPFGSCIVTCGEK